MKKVLPFLLLSVFFCMRVTAQSSLEKAAHDAFMISRMVEKYHVQPRPLDDKLSSVIFSTLLEQLDGERVFFMQDDIKKLSAYRFAIDQQVKTRQTAFLQSLITIFKQRLLQADSMAADISKKPFNFQIKEKFTVTEDTSYPASVAAKHDKLYKLLKISVLNGIMEDYDPSPTSASPAKKYLDSLEPILRKKAAHSIGRLVKRLLQSPKGVEYIIGNMYCQALASAYDPHTAYFPPDIKSAFESQIGNKPLEFGLTLNEDEDGNPEIGHLKPGSPAFQSGQINEGDKIQSIQWENKEPIDISDAGPEEISHMLAASGGNKVTITIKKADGTTRQVALSKAKVDDAEEEDKVKSFVLKGAHTFGFISLPDFYSDWEDTRGINGCANDVAKEIIKLKKENIEGLILDLRYNGGGSMEEAVELSGIFIDAGPVAQIKTREAKTLTLKDMNRGTIYDGPLILLVNGLSASASEMVAGTLQDYNRALIVGSPTYGKATAQVVLPIDTTINLDTYQGNKEADSYIKLTISKLYRINGTSAQLRGVVPDISLPDPTMASSEREANEKNAIQVPNIDANKYYKPLPALQVAAVQAVAKKELDSMAYFKTIDQFIQQTKKEKKENDISLLLDDAMQEAKKQNLPQEAPAATDKKTEKGPGFAVVNHSYDQRRLKSDEDLKKMDDEWKENLLNDPYVQMAYYLLIPMTK